MAPLSIASGSHGQGSRLAKWAVGMLTLVVVCQSLFLLSLMRSIPAHDSSSLHEQQPQEHASSSPQKQQEETSQRLHSTVAAKRMPKKTSTELWSEIALYFEKPNFPPLSTAVSPLVGLPDRPDLAGTPKPFFVPPATIVTTQASQRATTSAPHTFVVTPAPTESQPTNHLPRRTAVKQPLADDRVRRTKQEPIVQTSGDIFSNVRLSSSPLLLDALQNAAPPERIRHLRHAAVVVLCYNRPDLLDQTLASITTARLSSEIAKYISQDGDHAETKAVAQSAQNYSYVRHPRTLPGTLRGVLDDEGRAKETPSTMYLADHYKWALDEIFFTRGHTHAIIFEDDMKVSHDVFEMFEALAPLLDADPSLWCISSWNDNGFRVFDLPPDKFFRSSYFPGLGWMLKRELWEELSPNFPKDNWDHWMRATTTSKFRECVSPWRSRNYNLGVGGATSNEDFYALYLEPIVLNRGEPIAYGDLTYLLGPQYYASMQSKITAVPPENIIAAPMVTSLSPGMFATGSSYILHYKHEEFEMLGQALGVHPSPRSFYRRTQWLKFRGADLFLVDRRLSPFAPSRVRLRPHKGLRVIKATSAGVNCLEACMSYETRGSYACAADQFDFINDCTVISKFFNGCPNGCTQGWGDDIPNSEVDGVGHVPMCLATEVVPTCEASFPFTQRVCPCVGTSAAPAQQAAVTHLVAASRAGMSCDSVCSEFTGDAGTPFGADGAWECDSGSLHRVNRCDVLRATFPCAGSDCGVGHGTSLPYFVSTKSAGATFGQCLLRASAASLDCSAKADGVLRLCPCRLRS